MTLEETIDTVQKIHDHAAAENKVPGWTPETSQTHYQNLALYHKAGEDTVRRLVDELGAKVGPSGFGGHRLRLAGVATSCTSGFWGLMTNWLAAARKKLNKEKTS